MFFGQKEAVIWLENRISFFFRYPLIGKKKIEKSSIILFLFYLLFISHWPLLFYNNIAIHCKMLYANLSQQLHTIKTN